MLTATADDIYLRLTAAAVPGADAFDVHVVSAILALAWAESQTSGGRVGERCGLDAAALADVAGHLFPQAAWLATDDPTPMRAPDEAALVDLLIRGATSGARFPQYLAVMIARRAQCPNHLWQDLGLRNRDELGRLMNRHFAPLARRNVGDMKWKKFFYRQICHDAAYALCTAPSCDACRDFSACFGDEGGESLLAHIRREG